MEYLLDMIQHHAHVEIISDHKCWKDF